MNAITHTHTCMHARTHTFNGIDSSVLVILQIHSVPFSALLCVQEADFPGQHYLGPLGGCHLYQE